MSGMKDLARCGVTALGIMNLSERMSYGSSVLVSVPTLLDCCRKAFGDDPRHSGSPLSGIEIGRSGAGWGNLSASRDN